MAPSPKYPQFANIIFLGKVGETLRQAVGDSNTSDLPEDIRLLLRRLEGLERRETLPTPATNSQEPLDCPRCSRPNALLSLADYDVSSATRDRWGGNVNSATTSARPDSTRASIAWP